MLPLNGARSLKLVLCLGAFFISIPNTNGNDLTHAFKNKYDTAVLISNDSDLMAPISYIKSKMKKKIIVLNPHAPQFSVSRFWINALPSSYSIATVL